VAPSNIGNLYLLRLTYKIRPIEKQLPTDRELKTRAEADVVKMFGELFSARPTHPDDLALARRLLSHEQADMIVAGLLRDHLGARPEAVEEATAARRARTRKAPAAAPEPTVARPPAAEPAPAVARQRQPAAAPEPTVARQRQPAAAPEPTVARQPAAAPAFAVARQADVAVAERPVTRPSENDRNGDEPRRPRRPRRSGFRAESDEPKFTISDAPAEPNAAEVYVNVGQRDGATESDLRVLLEERAGMSSADTEYVHVRSRHSFVGVKRELLDRVIEALNGATIAGKLATAEEARPRPA
jgi:ATP-dependent RNA helicase DeaD